MYFKLALGNVKKSVRDYAIYFLTIAFGVCVFYAFNSVESQNLMDVVGESPAEILESLNKLMGIISVFIAVILGFLIVYANRYLIRRRTKEFGIYLTLGMERLQVARIIVAETVLIGVVSLGVGLVLGILLSQGLSLVAAKMFEADLAKFTFVFSFSALIKTLVYFGICFGVVTLFSVLSVMRYRLIELINADKKVEPVTIRSLWVSIPAFIVSLVLIGLAYYLLRKNGLLYMTKEFAFATAFMVVGTFLFFFSLSGTLLRVFQLWKGAYLRGLNMFAARQLSSKINTAFISVSLICILLFFAISVFAGGMAIASSENAGLEDATKYDLSVAKTGDPALSEGGELPQIDPESKRLGKTVDLEKAISANVPAYNTTVEDSVQIDRFGEADLTYKTLFPKGIIDPKSGTVHLSASDSRINMLAGIVPVSEFNDALELQGEKPITLEEGEYVFNVAKERYVGAFEELARTDTPIVVGGESLKPALDHSLTYQITSAISGPESIVVPDSVVAKIDVASYDATLLMQYKSGVDPNTLPNAIKDAYESSEAKPYNILISADDVRTNAAGSTVITSYMAIYIGFILLITCAAILALQQLSEASDNSMRYALLSKIGVDTAMSSRALFAQIGVYFFLPLGLALAHSYVALCEVEKLALKNVGESLIYQMLFLCGVVLAIYLVYFLVTYMSARTIVRTRSAH